MARRNVLTKDQPGLYKKCRPVTDFNPRLHQLLDDMAETLAVENGAGLAAPQVGVLRRAVIVMETNVPEGEEEYLIELINPVILKSSGKQRDVEGCLSCPDKWGYVVRPNKCRVRAQNRNGEFYEIELTELGARCACHEIDHLDGRLFLELVDEFVDPEEEAR